MTIYVAFHAILCEATMSCCLMKFSVTSLSRDALWGGMGLRFGVMG